MDKSPYWGSVWAIVRKDFQLEWRTKRTVALMVVFAITAVAVFNFALELELDAVRRASVGLLWVTILLAGTLGLNRGIAVEQTNDVINAFLIAPIDRSAIFVGKFISITAFTLVFEAILLPIFIMFTNKPFWRPQILGILFLGTLGYVAAGVLVSSMAVQTSARETLLPVLLLPLTLPVVLAAATAASAYILPEPPRWSDVQASIALIITYDVLMITAGVLLYQYVIEE